MDGSRSAMDQQYFDAAIRAVNEKKPIPEIDFTLVSFMMDWSFVR